MKHGYYFTYTRTDGSGQGEGTIDIINPGDSKYIVDLILKEILKTETDIADSASARYKISIGGIFMLY